ncbi:ABC transporter permease, partial [bacterium]|nr:ABC transporter permease [bacterium]
NLQKQVLAKKIDGYFVIPDSVFEKPEVKYSARNVGNMDDQRKFRYALSRIVTNYRLEKLGVSPQTIRDEMNKGRVKLVIQQVVESGEVRKSGQSGLVLTYILTYIILLMLMNYGQTLMRSVIEEKSQRITETILSSVKPFEMMLGKIIGIFLVGFTQLVINGLMILGIISFAPMVLIGTGQAMPELIDFMNQLHFTPQMFVFMLVFFTLGFIYFSSMFAAIGAMVNTEDEATQFQMPLIFLIMMGYFIMFSALQHPDTSMAYWSSLIPLFSPFVMFARISISDPFLPNGIWLSIGILILAIFLQVYISAKIYRVGILMYGKRPSFREAIRWLKY